MNLLTYTSWWALVLTAVIAYFLGCCNGAVIISKYILHDDVREHGSGNAGLTNFHRTFGGPLTFAVIAFDMLKAVLAVLLGVWLIAGPGLCVAEYGAAEAGERAALLLTAFAKYWAGLFCLLGHMYPVMFGFRGGKGVLSGGTLALLIDWRIALAIWGIFLVLTTLTRWVSLGSVCGGAMYPIATWFVYHDMVLLVLGLIMGGLVVWKHRGNIKRLLSGTERKLTFHKKKEGTR